ncbi:hypothetical protein [Saccharothrix deserti]|nr:hypothetical protein [Saccharothrix deserti]
MDDVGDVVVEATGVPGRRGTTAGERGQDDDHAGDGSARAGGDVLERHQ